eukprot:12062172-Alexandrium_andersonii.AAC.1
MRPWCPPRSNSQGCDAKALALVGDALQGPHVSVWLCRTESFPPSPRTRSIPLLHGSACTK